MKFSVEQMVELGFRQVFIPQMKTSSITAERIIRCCDYFGGVADKTEVEVK